MAGTIRTWRGRVLGYHTHQLSNARCASMSLLIKEIKRVGFPHFPTTGCVYCCTVASDGRRPPPPESEAAPPRSLRRTGTAMRSRLSAAAAGVILTTQ